MTKLLKEISFKLPSSDQEYRFSTTGDISRWLKAEGPFWETFDVSGINKQLRQLWQQQVNFFSQATAQIKEFESRVQREQEGEAGQFNQNLQQHFTSLSTGNVITSSHSFYPAIVDLSKTSPDLAAMLLAATRADAINTLGGFGNLGLPIRSIFQLILQYGRSKGTRDWLQPQRKKLGELEKEFQNGLDQLRTEFGQQASDILEQKRDAATSHQARIDEWEQRKDELAAEWQSLKKVYDEQLALLAPTQYWSTRATTHKNVAICFAIAFGLVLTGAIGVFVWLAMPHLFEVARANDVSAILILIPIAVPAFAGIWVLKMLSRLLSENLQMMRDARERETMVKTFLALLRDDKNGKSIVNDNDRILILHSLFRPTSVSAVDDAPPVHWFDILTNKVSGKR